MYIKTNFNGEIIIRNNPTLNRIKNSLIPSSDRSRITIKVLSANFRKMFTNSSYSDLSFTSSNNIEARHKNRE